LLGLNKRTYEMAGEETEGNVPGSYKEPGIGWMTGFLFAVSFVGIVALIPLRKVGKLSSLIYSQEVKNCDIYLSILLPQSCSVPHYCPSKCYPPVIIRSKISDFYLSTILLFSFKKRLSLSTKQN
jgi:hypothetical protein